MGLGARVRPLHRALLLCGGERLERKTEGYYMAPAVFAGTRNEMRINREEMFAPITCVIKADSYDEALAASAIRISLGPETTTDQVLRFADKWGALYRRHKERAA